MAAEITGFRLITAVFSITAIFALPTGAQEAASTSFKKNCAMCHAADGSGNSAAGKALQAKDLRTADVQKQSNAALIETVTNGKDKMPAFSDKLQPEEIKAVVAYVKTLGKKK
jgi:mono/diheme cytochrome c family protein